MTLPQKEFTFTTPSQRSDGSALNVGDIAQYNFAVTTANVTTQHTVTANASTPVNTSISVLFSALTPVFSPVGGASYTTVVSDADSEGNSSGNSNIVSWTEALAAPNAPLALSVS